MNKSKNSINLTKKNNAQLTTGRPKVKVQK